LPIIFGVIYVVDTTTLNFEYGCWFFYILTVTTWSDMRQKAVKPLF
jgi:hypothetical protein